MEEHKTEGEIWHKTCFKCTVCSKMLSVDTFKIRDGKSYCNIHYNMLMAPKMLEANEPLHSQHSNLIICENNPSELSVDVVRSSDKVDLGLEEISELNVHSKLQAFENFQSNANKQKYACNDMSLKEYKRCLSMLQTLNRFQKGTNNLKYERSQDDLSLENHDTNDNEPCLIKTKIVGGDSPIRFGIKTIKSKFENGQIQNREEHRELRKQELQHIRSRLFLGKQAKSKEQYQQAVVGCELAIKYEENELLNLYGSGKAKVLREKFENGKIFEVENKEFKSNIENDMDLFEHGIHRESRSLFLAIDANNKHSSTIVYPNLAKLSEKELNLKKDLKHLNLVNSDENADQSIIKTADISTKFLFFENYDITNNRSKEFQATSTLLNIPSCDFSEEPPNINYDDSSQIDNMHTTTTMINKFRELEQQQQNMSFAGHLKPLKQFTPPPEEDNIIFSKESNKIEFLKENLENHRKECKNNNKKVFNKTKRDFLNERLCMNGASCASLIKSKFEKVGEEQVIQGKNGKRRTISNWHEEES